MSKPSDLPDAAQPDARLLASDSADPRFDNDDVHEVHRVIRAVFDQYADRLLAGELWVADDERLARYVRNDELHVAVGTRLMLAPFDADVLRVAIEGTTSAVTSAGARPAWALSNPHLPRPVTRYGG